MADDTTITATVSVAHPVLDKLPPQRRIMEEPVTVATFLFAALFVLGLATIIAALAMSKDNPVMVQYVTEAVAKLIGSAGIVHATVAAAFKGDDIARKAVFGIAANKDNGV